MEEVIKLNAVDQYNKMFGLETLHPLVSVVDLSEATGYPRHFTLNYGVYALFLKNTKCGDIRYGKQYYDYQEGTVTSFAPGQVTEVNMLEGMQPSASGLLFHPDLIKGTSLGQGIKQYSFFSYSSTEALHLSEDEKEIFLDCLKKIKMEIQRPIDKHSKGLIARNIELLLDYCMRFYERQFITRSAANKDILMKFEALIDDYFQSDRRTAFREILRRQSVPLLQLFRRFGEEGNRKDSAGIYPEQNHRPGQRNDYRKREDSQPDCL